MNTLKEIREFRGEYRWLSSFAPFPVRIRHATSAVTITYPTREHAYQATKTLDMPERIRIATLATPQEAKQAGKHLALRPDWETICVKVMRSIIRAQIKQHPKLRANLLATGNTRLVEGNRWGDMRWGIDLRTGEGTNWLGEAWMAERGALRGEETMQPPAPAEDRTPAKTVSNKPSICATHGTPLLLEHGSGGRFSCPRCS